LPWNWVWAGAAAIFILLALWIRTQRDINEIKTAYARTPDTQHVASSTPSSQTAPAAVPPVTPDIAVSEQTPASPALSQIVPNSAVSQPAPEPVATTASRATAANVQPRSVPTEKKAQPDFRISGIITGLHPSAIVNGQTLSIGDQVDGATVAAIGRTTVTLEINGKRKIFQFR
jgi:hypothetical protein